ncbi:hypothetical protein KOAAANKH_03339 [Brevundimonas sp. NIBR10]|nr:hypothetical protein KOAAANKH_03339 [Brevundimonas sp. NIBR10]
MHISWRMVRTLAKGYHRRLCEVGEQTDVNRLQYVAPGAALPWLLVLMGLLILQWLIEGSTGQSLWFSQPKYLRWLVSAAYLIPAAGFVYAQAIVFISSWRAEMRRKH